jgi:hypothetical protein
MSIQKVNHPVWKAFDAQKILKTVNGTESEWWDTNGWTDKVVTLQTTSETPAGSAQIDVDVKLWVSPKGYYELRNEATVDTEDYEEISIVAAHGSAAMTRFDSSDVDDLQRPVRSMKVIVDNDHSTLFVTASVWVEGWS